MAVGKDWICRLRIGWRAPCEGVYRKSRGGTGDLGKESWDTVPQNVMRRVKKLENLLDEC